MLVTFDHLARLPVLRRFHWLVWRLFGVAVALVSPQGQRALRLGEKRLRHSFCARLNCHVIGHAACLGCDRRHVARAVKIGRPWRYRCWLGMTEFLVPIALDGQVIAFLQSGQICDKRPTRADWRRVRAKLEARGIPPRPLAGAFSEMRVIPPATQKELINLLDLLGNYIAEAQRRALQLEMLRFSRVTERAEAYIREHLDEKISLDDIAQAACSSKRNLSRVVKAETDRTVLELIHAERVAGACRRLQDTRQTCAQVAFACGFGTIQQFNRVFRRLKGCSPQEWRRRHLQA